MIIFRLKRIQQSASSLAVLRELVIYMPVPFIFIYNFLGMVEP